MILLHAVSSLFTNILKVINFPKLSNQIYFFCHSPKKTYFKERKRKGQFIDT